MVCLVRPIGRSTSRTTEVRTTPAASASVVQSSRLAYPPRPPSFRNRRSASSSSEVLPYRRGDSTKAWMPLAHPGRERVQFLGAVAEALRLDRRAVPERVLGFHRSLL